MKKMIMSFVIVSFVCITNNAFAVEWCFGTDPTVDLYTESYDSGTTGFWLPITVFGSNYDMQSTTFQTKFITLDGIPGPSTDWTTNINMFWTEHDSTKTFNNAFKIQTEHSATALPDGTYRGIVDSFNDPLSGITLKIANAGEHVGNWYSPSNNFAITTRIVPEPVSMLLFGLGGAILMLRRKS